MVKPMNLRGIGALQEMSEMRAIDMQARQRPMELSLADVMEDPGQPRQSFDVLALAELADSIAERGVKTPVSVRPHPTMAGKWMINHGARRYRASRMAGKATIPAFVDESHDDYDQMAENMQRDDLTSLEVAMFIQRRLESGEKKGEIARKLHKGPQAITEYMALIDAPDCIMQAYKAGYTSPKLLYGIRKLHAEYPEEIADWLATTNNISREEVVRIGEKLRLGVKSEVQGTVPEQPEAALIDDVKLRPGVKIAPEVGPEEIPKLRPGVKKEEPGQVENLVMTKKIEPEAVPVKPENLVMTKKDAPRNAENDQINAARYEHVRRMNPRQFAALWEASIAGKGTFDDLVDADIVHST